MRNCSGSQTVSLRRQRTTCNEGRYTGVPKGRRFLFRNNAPAGPSLSFGGMSTAILSALARSNHEPMSQNTKIAIIVVAVLVLGGLGYYWYQQSTPKPVGATFVNTPATLPSGTDTSDQGLQKDTSAIDAQLNGLQGDQATVNSSVNTN